MKFFVPVVSSLLLSLAAAQTNCPAKPVFDSCMGTTMSYVMACSGGDYGCLCRTWTDVLNCYLQCPDDIGYATASASKTAYCNSASAYPSTTAAVAPISAPAFSPSAVTNVVSSDVPTSTLAGSIAATTPRPTSTPGTSSSSAAPASTSGSSAKKVVVGGAGMLMGLVAVVL